jgi:high-affinity nickel permease
VLPGTSLLAYSFGLRRAVDADHVVGIDHVTRKLKQEGKRPIMVGFMFSLGHSPLVVLGAMSSQQFKPKFICAGMVPRHSRWKPLYRPVRAIC